tara:strand:- start:17 stop:544 length:528 start_codon:yes stop_codon:yes gene_type:complete
MKKSELRKIIREAINEAYNTSAEYPGIWDGKPSEKFSDSSFPSIGEQETNVKYDPVFGNFQGLDGKVNLNQLQTGIDNEDPEAIEVIKKLISSPEHSKYITKTPMGKPIDYSKEDNLEEKGGIFCCWRKGGCCFNSWKVPGSGDGDFSSSGISWHGCCSQGWPKNCCFGGVYDIW